MYRKIKALAHRESGWSPLSAGTMVARALMENGIPLGTALSLPERIVLRKVMRRGLLFAGLLFISFALVGHLFNALIGRGGIPPG